MHNSYPVYWQDACVGEVRVQQMGLYDFVYCRVPHICDSVCALWAKSGNKQQKIGVLVPNGKGYCLEKQIPSKRLAEEIECFIILSKSETDGKDTIFVPLITDKAVACLSQLDRASFHIKDGVRGLLLRVTDCCRLEEATDDPAP